MTAPAPTPQAGDSLGNGRYVVTQLIGEGAQGQTLQAIDKRDGTLVAIKRFSVRGASSWKDVELAEREARVLAQLDHPGLPRHLDHFEEDGALYLVMSLVEGESLAELRQRGELLDAAEVRSLLAQMAEVLNYLGRRAPPVIHRDIKPSNIVRRANGSYALVDFGSVRDHLKRDGSTVVGTFGYMAPEQFQGRALPVSDVYGLGATALTVLTGVAPDQQPHRGLGIDVARALGPGADSELVALLGGMLTPDPDVRTRDLVAALRPHAAPPRANYWQRARDRSSSVPDDARASPRPFAPPFILVIFGAGFWFSGSSQFSLMLPLMSLVIASVVWFYMSGGLKRTHRPARVSDRTRVRVEETTTEPFEDTAEDISSRNRQRR
ncbi:MAG: serine/threonine-protein kinase [Polyangiaceae bacterium]